MVVDLIGQVVQKGVQIEGVRGGGVCWCYRPPLDFAKIKKNYNLTICKKNELTVIILK